MPAEHPTAEAADRQPGSLAALVGAAVDAVGLYFESVAVAGEPGHRTLQVVVDRAEGTAGLDLDELAAVAGAVSDALDAAGNHLPELGAEAYQLEVSSPGVSRPLTEPRHWRRNVGRMVSVPVGEREITGRLQAADETGVVLVPVRPGAKKGMPAKVGEPERHAYDRLGPGRVQVELSTGGSDASREQLDTEV
ncbi:MAG: ribosome assembly cofactor RimP [Micrococcus sp.]|nr:ribosome assembly cofactor RimP [Micrococcus sp.]